MQIKELAQRSGLSIDTIRFYEKRGLIDERHFQRRSNGYRDYTEDAVTRLQLIKSSQEAGFTLGEIGELFAAWEHNQLTPEQIKTHLTRKLADIRARHEELDRIERYIHRKLRQLASEPT